VLLILGLILILFSCKVNLETSKKSILKVENKKIGIGPGGLVEYRNGHGSGFFINDSGTLVTNFHVIKGADIVKVVDSEGNTYNAMLIAYSIEADIAILTISKESKNFLELSDSEDIELGDDVYVIGYPLGLDLTITKGIIGIKKVNTRLSCVPLIQHDASLNPGASGSPLLDEHGNVIGINCGLYSSDGLYVGYSFAIPVNTLKQLLKDLKIE